MLRMTNKDKSAATWSDVKAKLDDFDRAGLLGLVQDLYTTSKDNQNFLHARFGLGCDVLKPYKTIIERWLWPDVFKHQEYSVSKAKRPITDYKKASGLPEGVAELTVYYCEQAISFSNEVGLDDGAYYDALVRMFEQALKTVMALPETGRESLLDRLQDVRASGQGIGWVSSTLSTTSGNESVWSSIIEVTTWGQLRLLRVNSRLRPAAMPRKRAVTFCQIFATSA